MTALSALRPRTSSLSSGSSSRSERTLSDNTVESYGRDIAKYFAFLNRKKISWEKAGEADVVQFIHQQSEGGLSRPVARPPDLDPQVLSINIW